MQIYTKEEKEEFVQLYKESGLSVRRFAEESGINLGTLRSWLYKKTLKVKPADDNCSFVQLAAGKLQQCRDLQNIRIQKAGMEIFIPVNLEFPVLEKILGALKII